MADIIAQLAKDNELNMDSEMFALWLDKTDPLQEYPDKFFHPTFDSLEQSGALEFLPHSERPYESITYLCGNSMGLQPKKVEKDIRIVLEQWANLGVYAYNKGPLPASWCDEKISEDVANLLVGANPSEVAVTSNLSTNMHSLLSTFYRPDGMKCCILIDETEFPSDIYALKSHITWHGLDPEECLILLKPNPGEWCLRTEDIVKVIQAQSSRIALVWLSGIQYITGQAFDIPVITQAVHEYAHCCIGWDLAHAIGNIPLKLHEWNVDIAVWCSYKYLNGSPGALGGLFIHQKHHHQPGSPGPTVLRQERSSEVTPRLVGWWGHEVETRFQFTGEMKLAPGADAYRISNPPLLLAAALHGSLDLIRECGGMNAIRKKSILLTGYFDYLLRQSAFACGRDEYEIITPKDPKQRGAQLTILVRNDLMDYVTRGLTSIGFIFDSRKSNLIRVSPCPLLNRFVDVHRFMKELFKLLQTDKLEHVLT